MLLAGSRERSDARVDDVARGGHARVLHGHGIKPANFRSRLKGYGVFTVRGAVRVHANGMGGENAVVQAVDRVRQVGVLHHDEGVVGIGLQNVGNVERDARAAELVRRQRVRHGSQAVGRRIRGLRRSTEHASDGTHDPIPSARDPRSVRRFVIREQAGLEVTRGTIGDIDRLSGRSRQGEIQVLVTFSEVENARVRSRRIIPRHQRARVHHVREVHVDRRVQAHVRLPDSLRNGLDGRTLEAAGGCPAAVGVVAALRIVLAGTGQRKRSGSLHAARRFRCRNRRLRRVRGRVHVQDRLRINVGDAPISIGGVPGRIRCRVAFLGPRVNDSPVKLVRARTMRRAVATVARRAQ